MTPPEEACFEWKPDVLVLFWLTSTGGGGSCSAVSVAESAIYI